MFVVTGGREQNQRIESIYNKRMCYAIKFLFRPPWSGADPGLQSALPEHTGTVAPLGTGAVRGQQPDGRRVLAGDRLPPGARLLSPQLRGRFYRRLAQQPVRADPGLGAGALQFPRSPLGGCAHRLAVRDSPQP